MITKFSVCRDDSIYLAWPDVALTPSGRLVCIFSECNHHHDRSYTRIMLSDSTDRGRTWSEKRPLTEGTKDYPFYNCARLTQLRDGRLVAIVDKLFCAERSAKPEDCTNLLYFSEDDGQTWSDPFETAALGIVPDKVLELECGRWIVAAHYSDQDFGNLIQRLWYTDDQGKTWSDPVIVGRQEGLNLCEVSILPVEGQTLVAFMRENSGLGLDCYKTISHDNGESWSEPVRFPLPGCHRPVAGWLQSGHILITHRFIQGGGNTGFMPAQNFFAGLTNKDSALALKRKGAGVRILPVDYDRSLRSDLGYSGWVQFDDGEIYIVNYIVDDAPKGQIRGYSLSLEDFMLA